MHLANLSISSSGLPRWAISISHSPTTMRCTVSFALSVLLGVQGFIPLSGPV